MRKGDCVIKEFEEPQMPGRGQQRRGRGDGRDTHGNRSHSSMSGVVRRCPPRGQNHTRRTSFPGGHWSPADATCLSEVQRSQKILLKPAGSMLLKRGATEYLSQPKVLCGQIKFW